MWAKEKGYWKIVSWKTDVEEEADKSPAPDEIRMPAIIRITADPSLVQAEVEAARLIRAGFERIGIEAGKVLRLDMIVTAADPTHPAMKRCSTARHARSLW